MKKVFLAAGLAAVLVGGVPFMAMAAEKPADKSAVELKKSEAVEKTGVVEVKKAEKNEKYNTVTLTVGTEK
ncbi:MAG TPA: hypothetical protein PKM25_18980, partial [Candidatus Ozemobacteraceae bacterium]|nr:hypothetical protein [Candidatus Ozemobacteraceae bacterium]